ncbi:MAG: glycoside hydrolase family 3 C-terminal domain-containing protein [Bacteroidales bacterium]|nr:glycoside hydrolase family 3 C-terminal domain-containing protein [Bacteroidales bacterium]MBN2817403.1 glycoside hydrolase family 3 C-terminal domain-containing protein [Bacteroidales bacterium]
MKKLIGTSNILSIAVFGLLLFNSCSKKNDSEKQINDIINKMTLDEKLDFIGGYNGFYIRGYEHLGIPEIRMADGPVGVRNLGPSTAYPGSIALAASFDKEIAMQVGKAIGSEARSKNVHIMLGPAMNIHRAPFCGRNFEYLGEDPYLAGQIAAAYTKGMQNEGIIATAKHYAVNYQDFNRHNVSSDLDERTLHEIYLPAFKTTVQEGNVATVMTAYNLINGVHASQHKYLINDVLKEKWGFEGFVMSDWVSTYDGIACAKNGLDLEMPSGKYMNPDTLKPAIESGELDIAVIDEKIRRILGVYSKFGLLENANIAEGYTVDSTFLRSTALEAARGGIVLLKNENSFLPLKKASVKSIAVIGPNGSPAVTGGGGSSFVRPLHASSVFEGLKAEAGDGVEVKFEQGVYTGERLPADFFEDFNFYIYENGQKKTGCQAAFYKNIKLEGDIVDSRVFDILNLEKDNMSNEKVSDEDFSVRFTCYFSPEETGYYWLGLAGDDGFRMFLDGKKVIEQWQNQGETIRKYETKLEAGKEYKVVVEYYQAGGDAVIRLGSQKRIGTSTGPEEYMAKAVNLAKNSDVAVLCVGFNNENESEGFDRTFEMPFRQAELIQKVSAVNPNTIVILNAGGNVDMSGWIENVPALLHAWYPGQEGGIALAEIIFGKTNPSGKLPVSFEKKWEDNVTYNSYFDNDNDLKVYFNEGIFLGYRHFDMSDVKPRYPFGYGLSYTTFEISDVEVDKTSFTANDEIKVSISVKNTGNLAGAEVIQLYVADKESSLPRPVKELKAFDKVFLEKGETKIVEIKLENSAFSFYDPEIHDWKTEPGQFTLFIGTSSVDIDAELTVNLVE